VKLLRGEFASGDVVGIDVADEELTFTKLERADEPLKPETVDSENMI
jgi:hypothetical protein